MPDDTYAPQTLTHTVTAADPEMMHDVGVRLGSVLRAGDIVVLTGELGAGKTTLTRGIGDGMGVRGTVTSPTFVLARTHPTSSGTPLIHVDAYRLGGADEFDDLDIDFRDSAVVIEWGAGLVDPELPRLEVTIERPVGTSAHELPEDLDAPEPRTLTLRGYGERWREGVASP